MRIFYDTEFIERGSTMPIIPISIGMVAEDGAELYLVNADAPVHAILSHEWLRLNVWPHISHYWEMSNEARENSSVFRSVGHWYGEVFQFCARSLAKNEAGLPLAKEQVDLWAYYADYDHVVLSQIFGTMIDLPPHIPMYTHDLKQAVEMLRPDWKMPQAGTEHDALADARWVADRFGDLKRWAAANDVLVNL